MKRASKGAAVPLGRTGPAPADQPAIRAALGTSSVDPGTTVISTTDVDNALDRDLSATGARP